MVPMAELRALFEALGFCEVKALLQSGNVVFETVRAADSSALEKKLMAAVKKKFGYEIAILVCDAGAWKKLVAGNPFGGEAQRDPSHLALMVLKSAPEKEALAALQAAIVGREMFRAGTRCLYIYYPDGIGRSKFTNAVIERKLRMAGTARNWNTVLQIASMLER
jgi:uncharacterized protein (DUF1697 family)